MVGERHYRAVKRAGLKTVLAIIRKYTNDEVIELSLVENVQREDLRSKNSYDYDKRALGQDF